VIGAGLGEAASPPFGADCDLLKMIAITVQNWQI